VLKLNRTHSFLKAFAFAILWGIFILVATLTPSKHLPSSSLFRFDKLIHLIIFLIFTYFILFGKKWHHNHAYNKPPILLFVFIVFYGIAIEALQSLIPSRSADVNDFIANTIGVFIGWMTFEFVFNKLFQIK
jgi:VanZ family protein